MAKKTRDQHQNRKKVVREKKENEFRKNAPFIPYRYSHKEAVYHFSSFFGFRIL